jgi:predicted AlkP superfamily pyrophosphatase or phosphodiesterase
LPGLRWYDRARTACRFPDYTRSYVGYQIGAVNRDIDPNAPTVFELCDSSLGALNVIGRGLPKRDRIGSLTARSAFRVARTHFTGNVGGWLQIDRDVADTVVRRVRRDAPEFVFAALTGVDKVSHARGHDSPMVMDALRIVDDAAARIRADAEQAGRWNEMSLWIV